MQMYLISDNVDTLTGMRLAGIPGCVVHERNELKTTLENTISNKEIGIILITEKLSREFPEITEHIKATVRKPLILEIPDRHGTGRSPNFITNYINEAIGLSL